MKNSIFALSGVLLIFSTLSCHKECNETAILPTVAFGKFYGECSGNCFTAYLLDDESLFADDETYYSYQGVSFLTTPLPQAQYETAKVLREEFPQDLLNTAEETLGCPDCHDQGGFYFEYRLGNTIKVWRVDTDDVDQSAAIIAYKAKVDSVMALLQ